MEFKVDDIELDYNIYGLGNSVVLLHAFPLNQTMWEPQVRELANDFQFITLDFRGFGESKSTDEPYLMEFLAADVHALLDHLKLDQVILCGLSMGGYVALAFYQEFPDMVQGLVLADTRAEADTDDAKKNRKALADLAIQEGARPVAKQLIPKLLGETTRASNAELVARVEKMIFSASIAGIANASLGMALRPDFNPTLKEITCPTLILVGEEDTLTPVATAEHLRDNIANAEMQVIPHAGHLSNLERPTGFNTALKQFLTQF